MSKPCENSRRNQTTGMGANFMWLKGYDNKILVRLLENMFRTMWKTTLHFLCMLFRSLDILCSMLLCKYFTCA